MSMLRKPLVWMMGCALLVIGGCSAPTSRGDRQETLAVSQSALSGGVTWTDVVGVDAVGSSLTKTASDGWNAGAASNESLSGDGSIEFTTAETSTHKMAGLTHAVTDSSYDDIDFAIFLIAGGGVDIYEAGALINGATGFGTYAANDVFSVQVTGGVVTYLKNGVLLYTSTKTPTFPLIVDTSLYSDGATINNVSLSATAYWQNVVGVSVSGQSLTKTGTDGWNAGASTVASLSGDGYTEFTTAETSTHKMAGLTHAVTDSSYDDIDFAIFLIAGGGVDIYEDGALINGATGFGTYAANDVFRVQVTSGVVTYLKNGSLLYTSTKTPTFPLVVDTSLYSNGATINNVSLTASAYWQNVVGVNVSGQSLTKTASDGWNAGASTVASVTGDCYAQFTTAETSTHKMAGLTHAVTDSSYDDIDFAIFLVAGGGVDIYEDGVLINGSTGFGTYAANDVFTVQVTSGVVTYLKNGALLYTSSKVPTFPLVVNSSLYSNGATVENVSLAAGAPPFWQNVVGVAVSGQSLTKTGSNGWNAGASTVSALTGDGSVQFTTAEVTTHKMTGLTHAVTDSSYDDIDFAIYLVAGGQVDIYEDGALINGSVGFGTYGASDVFSVQVTGGVVTYLKNGTLLYTSTKTPTFPLVVDSALYSTGATIQNVTISE